jgi:N-acetylglucosamine-6-sulfatase
MSSRHALTVTSTHAALRVGRRAAAVLVLLSMLIMVTPMAVTGAPPSTAGSAAVSTAGSTVGSTAVSTAVKRAAAIARPNIVFLMVDDMRKDELRFMPATRAWLAQGGATFASGVAPNPLCCPARASVLTGVYSHNHKVWSHVAPYGFHSFNDRSTLAVWLRRAGYTTTYLGKYLNGYGEQPPYGQTTGRSVQYVPPGWSQWRASIDGGLPLTHPMHGGTYGYFDTTLNNRGNGFLNYEGRYQTDVYADLTVASIKRLAPKSAPFFSYVSFTAPHGGGPREADDPAPVYNTWGGGWDTMVTPARPQRAYGRFDAVITQAPGRTWYDEPATDLRPAFYQVPPIGTGEWASIQEAARQRAESLSVVDHAIDRIMIALRNSGELGRTIVVFTSDNGYFLGEQRIRQGKSYPYGPSGRVPLLVRGPGIPGGVVRRDPFLSIDFAPTLARAAGVATPYATDGVSMLAVARTGDRGWQRAVLTETPAPPGGARGPVIGIRTWRYLYTNWRSGDEELFDLSKDPAERHNVAGRPEYRTVLDLLRQSLAQQKSCKGGGCSQPLPAIPAPGTG